MWSAEYGDYDCISEIACESTTVVIRAVHRPTNEDCAVKFPRDEHSQTSREAKILRGLGHQAIIELKAVIETDNGPALVLPLAFGGDLFDAVTRRGCLPEPDAMVIAFRLLSALDYCHRNGVWHRDVKLENVFVMSDDVTDVVLADFGFAVDTANGGFDGLFTGSLEYAAPEILRGSTEKIKSGYYTEKVDIWSTGITLFAIISGFLPFDAECEFPDEMVIAEQVTCLPVSQTCQDLLLWMLRTNPDERINAAEALRHPWFLPLVDIGKKEPYTNPVEVFGVFDD
jgi:serine/threonine protein kinase